YSGKGLHLQDLIEEGNLGLMRAVEGFDPSMGTPFSTYASYWIKHTIRRALASSSKTIRLPTYMVGLLSLWRRAATKLQNEQGRPPTSDEIAQFMGLPKKKLAMIEKAIRVYNSGPAPEQANDPGWSLDEALVDIQGEEPDRPLAVTDEV